ncbi:phosphatase 2C-like domain-containing protein [Lentinula aciculospora]|uniref:Phosphatase 2C-like domain-containing protein n=1 Tax=Lentinula aciculospora TaxID=153920 RepID=A0A9W9DL25_9AGAR|nr:phosphatase 2C-like domain-containing protein [Lentinula aciculospora]
MALFDGHNGPAMSDFLCDHLVEYVASAISKLPQQYELSGFLDIHNDDDSSSDSSAIPADDIVSDTIKQAFKEVDDVMIDVSEVLSSPSKTNAVRTLRHAHSGSCALMSVYDVDTRILRVALTGDSRAVLGRKVSSKNGKTDAYEVHLLSYDQNAHNPKEVARLEAEHPGEEVVKNGRVMGWGMARAFGDAAYKWSVDIQEQLYEKYLGDRVRSNMKTPPYLTAEPEITTTRVQKGDFIIMASDGLWDCLTSEEAVGLVGVWLANNIDSVYTDSPVKDFAKKRSKDDKVYTRDELPLKVPLEKVDDENDETLYYPWWHATKQFVNRDSSAAAHLARNALGGADSDLTEALVSLAHPRARKYR